MTLSIAISKIKIYIKVGITIKQILSFLFIVTLVIGFSNQSHAALELRGEGTSADGTYRLIYDTDFNITWYDYTKTAALWQTQVNWADGLDVDFGGTHYTDWRLPTALNQDGSRPCGFYNCTGSEMGHLYYTELGNSAGGTLSEKGDFKNLLQGGYWTGTEYTTDTNDAWGFSTYFGYQVHYSKTDFVYFALAVRPGDVSVAPEPISSILFISGGVALIGRKYIRRRKKIEV